MIVVAPGMAFLSWYVADLLNNKVAALQNNTRAAATGGLVGTFAFVFLRMSVVSVVAYLRGIPSEAKRLRAKRLEERNKSMEDHGGAGGGGFGAAIDKDEDEDGEDR